VIDHVALLLVMGVAAAGALALVLRPTMGDASTAVVVLAWLALAYVPLVLMQSGRLPDPLSLGTASDYGAAAPLHVSMFGVLAAIGTAGARGRSPAGGGVAPRWTAPRFALAAVAATSAWTAWLVALEGELSSYTFGMATNTLIMAGCGGLGAVAAAVFRRRRPVGVDFFIGTGSGLAAATGAAATLPSGAAVAVGILAGSVTLVSTSRWSRTGDTGMAIALGTGIGAVIGLVALGSLDARAGFFFSGQPTLALAQVTLVAVTLTLGYAVGILAVLAALRLRGASEAERSKRGE
jgi:ammonia channel protein AmtB